MKIAPAARPSQIVPAFQSQSVRFYSAPAGLSKEEVEGRIVNLLKNFEKVRHVVFTFPEFELKNFPLQTGLRCQQGSLSFFLHSASQTAVRSADSKFFF